MQQLHLEGNVYAACRRPAATNYCPVPDMHVCEGIACMHHKALSACSARDDHSTMCTCSSAVIAHSTAVLRAMLVDSGSDCSRGSLLMEMRPAKPKELSHG